jgi:hypothetical protein
MLQKWISLALFCALLGILAGLGYLLIPVGAATPYHSPLQLDWLIWLFCGMLFSSLLLNIMAFFGAETWSGQGWWLSWFRQQQQEPSQQLRLFFQQHAAQLHQLSPAADLFLWSHQQQTSLIKLVTPAQLTSVADGSGIISQMRQLLQQKLQYQCRQAYWLSAEPVELVARVYARESGIQCLQFHQIAQLAQVGD